MKSKISFLFSLFLLVAVMSCEDDTELLTVDEPSQITLSPLAISNIELDPVNVTNPAVTFNWTIADFGQPASENYALQLATDDAFTNPITPATVTGNNTITLSVSELNSAAGELGLPPFAWNTIHARIVASLGTQNGLPSNSNSINFQVFPFFNYPFQDFFLVGNATAADWNNNNNNPALFRDAANDNRYFYTGYFNAGQFKVLEIKGLWQPQWGTNDGTSIDVNPGDASDPGTFPNNNSDITASGFYTFTMDVSNNTFSFVPFDESSAADFSSITIEGSGTSSGIAMSQLVGFDSHIWFANSVTLTPGDVQFVTNTGSTWGGTTEFSGQASENGSNIPVVVQDEYDVWFNDLTGRYIFIPLNL